MKFTGTIFQTLVYVCVICFWAVAAEVEMAPLKYGIFTTLGVIDANGDTTASYGTTGEPIDNQPYSRYGAWFSAGGTIGENTEFSLLLAMMTWNSLPLTSGSPFSRMQSGGSDVQAWAAHRLGDPEKPIVTFKLGAFPYSYSSSKNLGGHLFTGGTYPGALTSNFWQLLDGNFYKAQGLMARFSFLDNAFNIDATAFFEHGIEPNYDLSPGIVASYNFAGMVEIGAGAVFSHLLAWDADAVTPEKRTNAYYNDKRLPVEEWGRPGYEPGDTLIVPDGDPRIGVKVDATTRPDLVEKGLPVKYVTAANNGVPNSQLGYYTFKGIKAMGRIALTPFSFGEDLKKVSIYSEATLLGVKDYPFYYENKSERLPITIGMNLPLPGGIEVSVDAEHYKNKFKNHVNKAYQYVTPQWQEDEYSFFVDSLDANGFPINDGQGGYVPSSIPRVSHQYGDWYWSATAKMNVLERINIGVKIAHDYLRLYNFFANPSNEPAFQHSDGWYLVIKTEVAI